MPIIILRSNILNDKQKLLYCLISSLCAERWFCWASNKYLWDTLNVGTRGISKNINILAEMWLISIEITHWKERKIKLKSKVSNKLLASLNNDSEKSLASELSLPLWKITSSDSEKSLAPLWKITSTPNEFKQLPTSENPWKLVPNNIIEYNNIIIKENSKEISSTATAVSPQNINSRSEKNNEDIKLSKTQKREIKMTQKQARRKEVVENIEYNNLLHTICNREWQNTDFIDSLRWDWVEIKCEKNLKWFTDRSVKIALNVLNQASCYREQLVMLTEAVGWWWSWQHKIKWRENKVTEYDDLLTKQKPQTQRVSWNMFH